MKKLFTITLLAAGVLVANSVSAKDMAAKIAKSEARAEKQWQKMDTTKDNKLSKEEYTESHKERIHKKFDKLDANKDGSVTKEEMKTAREKAKQKRMENKNKKVSK